MMTRIALLAAGLALGILGCGSEKPSEDSSDGADSSDPWEACSAEDEAVAAFVRETRSCAADDECVSVSAECMTVERLNCSGTVYVSATYDAAEFDTLHQALSSCITENANDGVTCTQCLKVPREPACIDGRCGPSAEPEE